MGGCCLDPKKSRQELSHRIFEIGVFWDGLSHYAATPLSVALSLHHSNVTRFRPWSPFTTGNHLDRAEKIPKVPQMTGSVDIFDLRSGIAGPHFAESFRMSTSSRMMPSCSAIDLSEIRRSSKISLWI